VYELCRIHVYNTSCACSDFLTTPHVNTSFNCAEINNLWILDIDSNGNQLDILLLVLELAGDIIFYVFTGASSGIGAASAVKFAKHGCRLVITGRNQQALNEVADLCVEEGITRDNVNNFMLHDDIHTLYHGRTQVQTITLVYIIGFLCASYIFI